MTRRQVLKSLAAAALAAVVPIPAMGDNMSIPQTGDQFPAAELCTCLQGTEQIVTVKLIFNDDRAPYKICRTFKYAPDGKLVAIGTEFIEPFGE